MQRFRKYEVDTSAPLHSSSTCTILKGNDLYSGERVVLKLFQKSKLNKDQKERCEREIKVLRLLQGHHNVVRLLECFEDNDVTCLVMEYIEKDLLTYFEGKKWKLSKPTLKSITRQIVEVTKYMHDHLVVHCDLKLENFLYDEKTGIIKVIDFGQSFLFSNRHTYLRGICGTKRYVAPEVLMKEREGWDPYKCDVYAMGVVLYALVYGKMPFPDRDGKEYYSRLIFSSPVHKHEVRPDLKFPQSEVGSAELRHLFEKLLSLFPEERPSLEQIQSHQFFSVSKKSVTNFFRKLLPVKSS
jgi:serine/threonine protein kinase